MELDAAAAVMAGLGGVAPPAVDEFRDFLQKIKAQVQVTDFIQVVGTDLLGAKVISAADFSTLSRGVFYGPGHQHTCDVTLIHRAGRYTLQGSVRRAHIYLEG